MKKLWNIIGVFILCIFLTGCVKYSYTFDVNDNSLKIEETRAIDTTLLGENRTLISRQIDDKLNEAKEKNDDGYIYEKYEEPNYIGVKRSKDDSLKKIKNSDLPDGFSSAQEDVVDITKGMLTTYYRVHLFFNPETLKQKMQAKVEELSQANSKEPSSQMQTQVKYKTPDELSENSDIDNVNSDNANTAVDANNNGLISDQKLQNFSQIEPKFDLVIKIPKKARMHNAKKVLSDKEYYWELSPSNESEIIIVYSRTDFSTLGSTLVILFIVFVSVYYFRKFKRRDDDD